MCHCCKPTDTWSETRTGAVVLMPEFEIFMECKAEKKLHPAKTKAKQVGFFFSFLNEQPPHSADTDSECTQQHICNNVSICAALG